MAIEKHLTAFGETKCIKDWVLDPRCKVGPDAFYLRLKKGWSVEDALQRPKYNSLPKEKKDLTEDILSEVIKAMREEKLREE